MSDKPKSMGDSLKQFMENRKNAPDTPCSDWCDKWGSCKVCGGEIPEGHHPDCFIYKTERELTTEYQRGLNDGLEQAARICDERAKEAWLPSLEESEKGRQSMTEKYEAEECAEAIRAQIKK